MCGIVGIIGSRDDDAIKKMADIIHHRGPDEEGFYLEGNISLGIRRLSIIDLVSGSQPIFNEDNSVVVVYNGEIYNYQSLRDKPTTKGHVFRTFSDTEVIVHAYEEYGIDCLKRFNGDFAFALHDKKTEKTFIARDRLGIRPLYYCQQNGLVLFASEMKSILASKLVKKDLNLAAIDKYLTLRYNYGDESFFKGIYKLPPACYMHIKGGRLTINPYWEIDYTPVNYKNERDYIEKFDDIFRKSVEMRMISDVPIGAYLSGGLDSSLIVALMAEFSDMPVETYSLGFNHEVDETVLAKKTSKELGCTHHEIMLEAQDYSILPKIIQYFDEPIGDSIILPTYLLSNAAGKNLKVVLTGEGADEIFGGYVHHQALHYAGLYNQVMPSFITSSFLIPGVKHAPMEFLDAIFPYPSKLGKKGKQKLLDLLHNLNSLNKAYFDIASVFKPTDKELLYTNDFKKCLSKNNATELHRNLFSDHKDLPILNRLIDVDTKYWLPDYTLFKQDRLTMANSIEGRIPYLDHNLVEFVSQIPLKYKIRGLDTKYLLRKVAEKYLPKSTAFRKKKAFYFPYQDCFKDDFNVFVKGLFEENSRIIELGLVNKAEIAKLYANTSNMEILDSKKLMSLVILENWLRIYT